MGIEYLSYSIPADKYSRFGNNNGSNVQLKITYSDTPDSNGYYQIIDVSGTYQAVIPQQNGSTTTVTHNITGLSDPDDANGADNLLFIGQSKPFVTNNGIAFTIDGNPADSNDGNGNVVFYNLSNATSPFAYGEQNDNIMGAADVTESDAPCFVQGTLVRTARGDVAVQDLRAGDHAITLEGRPRRIRWVGHRVSDLRLEGDRAHPVRVEANAFGAGRPARDLYLSPGHPVLVGADHDGRGGHLVPIMCLINGTTIERVAVDEVTYWHIELDEHDILLAEGLPAESYIDLGSRPWFAGGASRLYDPDLALPGMPGRCRPVAIDGPVVEAERHRIDQVFAVRLADACAWPQEAPAIGWIAA